MTDLAEAVLRVADSGESTFHPPHELGDERGRQDRDDRLRDHRADRVVYGSDAQVALRRIKSSGWEGLPCAWPRRSTASATTPRCSAPTGFKVTVKDIEIAAGAGFAIPSWAR